MKIIIQDVNLVEKFIIKMKKKDILKKYVLYENYVIIIV